MTIVKDRDIIVVGLQPWDGEIGSNCKNIAIEFAKHNRVLYVNYPLDRISIKREANNPLIAKRIDILKNKKNNLLQINQSTWQLYPSCILESINWIPSTFLFKIINKINNWRFASEIKKAAQALNFKNYILFNDSDMFRSYHLPEMLKPVLSMYYTRDNMMSVPYWYKHGHILEPELIAKSDVITANSTYLADIAKQHNSNSYYVGQGCETEAFDLEKITYVPKDIENIKGPIIGYIGALYKLRLDLDLIEHIANSKPEWSVVLIGPEDEAFKKSNLHHLSNVHFLGLKDTSELPAYLAKFDIAINPQILNEVTIGNYPRKIDEYLAMGKPTVATETKAMSIFKDYTYLGKTKEDYITLIEKALAENSAEKQQERISYARSHIWENSVAEIYKAMLSTKKI
ncbi:MAG: glycosyltransferase [Candidatus Methylacidiphilales bacterium]